MFGFFARKRQLRQKAEMLYVRLRDQSRNPVFFMAKGVPDSFDGRFDSLLLHAFLVLNRLQSAGAQGDAVNQALFDVMFREIHHSLRQIGVGDLGVPHHLKRMMKAFKGRSLTYQAALQSEGNPDPLFDPVRRNLFGTVKDPRHADVDFFCRYVRENAKHLAAQDSDAIMNGEVFFKDVTDDLSRMVA